MTIRQESPIFSKLHDLFAWLLQATARFPREQRFVLARRAMDKAFDLEDSLVAASFDRENLRWHLQRADIALHGLRRTINLAADLKLISDGQYKHAAEMTAEIGRLLGGWAKRVS